MDEILSDLEARVLGCLIEKAMTTPEVYPLSLRALTAACNQRNNRDPVIAADEAAVEEAVGELRLKGLARQVSMAGSRTLKYRHHVEHFGDLDDVETAALGELLLRGPQTAAEVRARSARMLSAPSESDVFSRAIHSLMEWGEAPLVVELPRETGRREVRIAHTLCGNPVERAAAEVMTEAGPPAVRPLSERIAELETQLAALSEQVDALQKSHESLLAQLE